MKSKNIEVFESWKVEVNCKRNDWEDIKCGGSPILGYDFYVDRDLNKEDVKKFIRETFKEFKRKHLIGIHIVEGPDIPKLWELDKIKECIRKNNFDHY